MRLTDIVESIFVLEHTTIPIMKLQVVVLLLLAAPALIAADGPNLTKEKGKVGSSAAVTLAKRGLELAAYAREAESPIVMLAAIEILGRVRFSSGEQRLGRKVEEGRVETLKIEKKTPAPTQNLDALAKEAKGWANADPILIGLIDRKLAEAQSTSAGTLGAAGGPISHRDRVLGNRTDVFTIRFVAGERARVAVLGDGDTDLDLAVEDENGRVVYSDLDMTDSCAAEWTPAWTGIFKVKIINNGSIHNQYLLLTN